MTVFEIVLWFVFTAAVYVGLYFALTPLRKKDKVWVYVVIAVTEAVIALACAYFIIAFERILPRLLSCFLAVHYTAFLADAAVELVFLIIRLIGKHGVKGVVRMISGMVSVLLFLAYMVVNSQIVVPNYHTYYSDKLNGNHKFVYISDLHFGHTQSVETVKKALAGIKSEEPEFLLLGGDITDELTSKEDMKLVYELIGSIEIPVYFAYGNHDRQNHADDVGGRTYTDAELENAIKSSGIHILCDDYIELDDIVILGREDYDCENRLDVDKLKPRPDGKFVINLDHSPYLYDDIAATGADLQLSGHVHAGQLFPLRWLYALAVDNIYGDYVSGDTDIYVSSGISGWCFPLRSEAHCCYEVITLTN